MALAVFGEIPPLANLHLAFYALLKLAYHLVVVPPLTDGSDYSVLLNNSVSILVIIAQLFLCRVVNRRIYQPLLLWQERKNQPHI